MSDVYTKAVLTAIAIALFALVGQNARQAAVAQTPSDMQRVVLCDLDKHCTKLVSRESSSGSNYFLPTFALQPGP